MKKHDEVQERLEQIGRLPVPQPRSEFVDSLLPRIHLLGDLTPADVPHVGVRSNLARLRMVAVGSAAAVILGAVGFLAASQNGTSQDIATINMSNGPQAQVAGGLDISEGAIVVCADIDLVDDDGDPCDIGEQFTVSNDELVPVDQPEVEPFSDDGYAPLAESSREVATGSSEETTPTSAKAPVTTQAVATTQAPVKKSTTTVPPSTTTTTAEIEKPTPTPIEGDPSSVPPRPEGVVAFPLQHVIDGDAVTLAWDDYPYGDFGGYAVVRTVSADELKPDTPAYPARGGAEQLDFLSEFSTYTDTVPDGATWVAYKVAVLDRGGKLVGLSSEALFRVEYIDESQLSPSGESTDPADDSADDSADDPATDPDGSEEPELDEALHPAEG